MAMVWLPLLPLTPRQHPLMRTTVMVTAMARPQLLLIQTTVMVRPQHPLLGTTAMVRPQHLLTETAAMVRPRLRRRPPPHTEPRHLTWILMPGMAIEH